MPSQSQAQSRFMHAVAEGKVEGVPQKVGQDFVAADAGRKIGALPEHVKQKKTVHVHIHLAQRGS